MRESGKRRHYEAPKITSEKVFEQAALSCVVSLISATLQVLKIDNTSGGCGYTSS